MKAGVGWSDKIVAIILAAGASTRLGRPKQLVQWEQETLLERAIRIAIEAGCMPVVVLGYNADEIACACDLSRSKVIINPAWQQGMGNSIRVGVEAARIMGANAAVIMTCDQPAVTSSHLLQLIAASAGTHSVASAYSGRKGVPAYIPSSSFAPLQALQGDSGARDLLRCSPAIDLPLGELDVDTEEELSRAQNLLLHGTT